MSWILSARERRGMPGEAEAVCRAALRPGETAVGVVGSEVLGGDEESRCTRPGPVELCRLTEETVCCKGMSMAGAACARDGGVSHDRARRTLRQSLPPDPSCRWYRRCCCCCCPECECGCGLELELERRGVVNKGGRPEPELEPVPAVPLLGVVFAARRQLPLNSRVCAP